MGQFSLKRLFASVALAAIGIWMATQINYFDEPKRLIDALFWFSMWPVFGAAILNLWAKPIRGAKFGFVAAIFIAFYGLFVVMFLHHD